MDDTQELDDITMSKDSQDEDLLPQHQTELRKVSRYHQTHLI